MDEKDLNVNILRPFGPPVGITKIPDLIIKEINDYVDNLEEKKIEELDYGTQLAGNVTQEIMLDKDIVKKNLLPFLGKIAQVFLETVTKKKILNFNLLTTWVVRQFKNEYNPIHWHTGHLSGVGYLKVPNFKREFIQKKKDHTKNEDGKLHLCHGSRQFLSFPIHKITPEVGKLVVFPTYMMHVVYPFLNSTEERRSISFNAKVDDEIFNKY